MTQEIPVLLSRLCALLRAAIWNEKMEFPADWDWDAIYRETKSQAVSGLFWRLLPSLPISESLRQEWRTQALEIIAGNMKKEPLKWN